MLGEGFPFNEEVKVLFLPCLIWKEASNFKNSYVNIY